MVMEYLEGVSLRSKATPKGLASHTAVHRDRQTDSTRTLRGS